MKDLMISVENLSKRYRLGVGDKAGRTIRETIMDAVTAPVRNLRKLKALTDFENGSDTSSNNDDILWALKDVSFQVGHGEVVGVIGRNGAGKSTLLKILSRITEPSSGEVKLYGRVSSLLEVGTGFHPELTGRENIYLNGTILGMRKREIDAKFKDIVNFSEIGKFIDTPVKRYSSGMYVRLAFAVAAHLDPEIFLVDEVLAVGDYKFQEKCLGKMSEVTSQGRTVLFVSHNMKAVESICSKTMLISGGKIEAFGDTKEVVKMYTNPEHCDNAERRWDLDDAPGNHTVKLLGVSVKTKDNKVKPVFDYKEEIHVCVKFQVFNEDSDLYLRMYLQNEDGIYVLVTTDFDNNRYKKGVHEARYVIPQHVLNEGYYSVQQVLFKEGAVTSGEDVARVDYPVSFSVDYSKKFMGGMMGRYPGIVRPDWKWKFTEVNSVSS